MKTKYIFLFIACIKICTAQESTPHQNDADPNQQIIQQEEHSPQQPLILDSQTFTLNTTQTWDFACIIKGNSTINGNKNALFLGAHGKIVIEQDATLLMRNLQVYGIKNNTITFTAPTLNTANSHNGKLFFDDVMWALEDHYSFDNGSFHVVKNRTFCIASQDKIFSYNSANKSFIGRNGHFGILTTLFIYNPLSKCANLIECEDPYSTLLLDGSTLMFANVGLALTRGRLFIVNNCHLINVGNEQCWFGVHENKSAISLGNKKNSKENMDLFFHEQAHLTVLQGKFLDNNIYQQQIGDEALPDFSQQITFVH